MHSPPRRGNHLLHHFVIFLERKPTLTMVDAPGPVQASYPP